MNWARVKSVFIILLLGCNLVLCYVYKDGQNLDNDLELSENKLVKEMTTKLRAENINLDGVVPPAKDVLPNLIISEMEIDFDLYKQKFSDLGLIPYSLKTGEGYLYTYKSDSSFSILYYGDIKKIKKTNFKTALKTAEKLVNSDIKQLEFKYYKNKKLSDGSYEIYFEESYNGIRILDGYTIIRVKGDRVLNLEQKIVKVKEDRDKIQSLIPYHLALYRLYGLIEETKETIDIDEVDIVQEIIKQDEKDELISGETFVYYRFNSKKGEYYLIDAIDNNDR